MEKEYGNEKIFATSFRDIKKRGTHYVNLLGNICDDKEVIVKEKKKPKNVTDYNNNMQFVDKADQDVLTYLYKHKHFSWKRALVFYYFKLLVHNSKILYEKNTEKKVSLRYYLVNPCEELAGKKDFKPSKHELLGCQNKRHCSSCYPVKRIFFKTTSS